MKRTLFILLVNMFILSACAGAGGPSTTINATMTDFSYSPDKFTIPAGQDITINIANEGAVEHDFIIFKFGTDAGEQFGPEDQKNIYWEVQVPPGESKSATFTAPVEPGAYFVTCGVEGHMFSGMVAKLIVVAGK